MVHEMQGKLHCPPASPPVCLMCHLRPVDNLLTPLPAAFHRLGPPPNPPNGAWKGADRAP